MKNRNTTKKLGRKQTGRYQRGPNTAILSDYFPYKGKYCIYGLTTENEPNVIYYVGYTKSALNRRYANHKSNANQHGTPKERWVWDLILHGLNMVLIVLEEGILTHEEACEREQYYIQKMKDEKHPLKNVTRGGMGTLGRIASEETRLKTSISNKGKRLGAVVTEETRRKISASFKNRRERAAEAKNKRKKE